MSRSVNIPEYLYQQAQQIAESQHVSVDEVISSAFAEQLAVFERLKQRAARGRREAFTRVLDAVPSAEPESYDQV